MKNTLGKEYVSTTVCIGECRRIFRSMFNETVIKSMRVSIEGIVFDFSLVRLVVLVKSQGEA